MGRYTTYTDEQLTALVKTGNEDAFAEIYHRYWKRLYFTAHKKLQSAQDAKEIVQEVFLALWKQRETAAIQALPIYLAAMTRYMVYRHLSNREMRESHLKALQKTHNDQFTSASDIDNRQLLDILTRFSNTLPQKYKIVFIHHKLLDQPLEQVAEKLGISPRTAETYVTKVMQIMRKNRDNLGVWLFLAG